MTANTGIFCGAFVMTLIIGAAFGVWHFKAKDAVAATDAVMGYFCQFAGMALGAGVIAFLFAFIAGKFSS